MSISSLYTGANHWTHVCVDIFENCFLSILVATGFKVKTSVGWVIEIAPNPFQLSWWFLGFINGDKIQRSSSYILG
jgi:hypothetical protein